MLTVVDNLSGSRVLIRRCAAAKVWSPFKQCDLESDIGKSASCGQARQPAPDHRHFGSLCPRFGHARRLRIPFPKIAIFSRVLRLILPWKTS